MEKRRTCNRKKTMCISDIDIIELEEMRFWAHHGCLESEKKKGNLFLVDFKGEMNMKKAAGSDSLEDTVNYGAVYELVRQEMSVPSDLLEHVAGRIVRRIAEAFPEFIRFSVRISKRRPPVGGPVQWSRVTLSYCHPEPPHCHPEPSLCHPERSEGSVL